MILEIYILISRSKTQSETDTPVYITYIQKINIAFAL